MTVNLLTEHHLEFLSLNGGCTGSSESTLVKMPHCWKSPLQLILSSKMTEEYDFMTYEATSVASHERPCGF